MADLKPLARLSDHQTDMPNRPSSLSERLPRPLIQRRVSETGIGRPRIKPAVKLGDILLQDLDYEPDITMLRQPETRPISHDQLVVEVKGIYAEMVMVQAKCIEVDELQEAWIRGEDDLAPGLVALHKQVIHEHPDFFSALDQAFAGSRPRQRAHKKTTSKNNITPYEEPRSSSSSQRRMIHLDDNTESVSVVKQNPVSRFRQLFETPRKVIEKINKVKRGLASYVNGAKLSVLADTGAGHNVMSEAYARERNFPTNYSDTMEFQLGNSKAIESIGTVNIDYAFEKEYTNTFKIKCHVLQDCVYDLILGDSFLSATKTMSENRHRLTQCVFSVAKFPHPHLSYMGNCSQRLRGLLADYVPVLAMPDSGAECNVMDFRYVALFV